MHVILPSIASSNSYQSGAERVSEGKGRSDGPGVRTVSNARVAQIFMLLVGAVVVNISFATVQAQWIAQLLGYVLMFASVSWWAYSIRRKDEP